MVYIDGNHAYDYVKRDLENCAPLVAKNGILCGDDLELQMDEVDKSSARENASKKIDFTEDPKTDKPFHPGVTIAVEKFFNCHISSEDGFFFMRKTNHGWEKVSILKSA